MKKNLFLIMGLILISCLCNGQDKIIRTNGDKIDCRIMSVDSVLINLKVYRHNIGYETRVNFVRSIII